MSGVLTLPMLGLIVFCIVAEAVRELCFKFAADDVAFLVALAKPITWLGIVFWAMELVGWTLVLEHVPISLALPLMALGYVVIVAAGAVVLHERVTLRHGVGALFITAGVACVGVTGL